MSQPPHIDADNPWLQAMADTLFRVPEALDLRQLGQAPFVDAQGRIVGETDPTIHAESRNELVSGVSKFVVRNPVRPAHPPLPIPDQSSWAPHEWYIEPETEQEIQVWRQRGAPYGK